MSNRRDTPPVSEALHALDGLRVPGGCEDCDAYQVVRSPFQHPNLTVVQIFHDDWCPTLARMAARADAS